MSSNKIIAKNTMYLYVRMFLIMIVSLYTSRKVLHILGAVDLGIYNVVGGLVTMFAFINGSMILATTRYITLEIGRKDRCRQKNVFNVCLTIHILISIIVLILAETIGLWFLYKKMVIPPPRFSAAFWVYQISVLTSMFSLTQVPYNALIIAHERMKIYSYISICEALGKLIIIILVNFVSFDKLIYYAFLVFLLQMITLGFYRYYCITHYQESKIQICKDKNLYKEIFNFAGFEFVGSIAYIAEGQGINIILNLFFGPTVNAARAIAYQVETAVAQFSNNFMTAVNPSLIKLYAENKKKELLELMYVSSNIAYCLILLIVLPICFECKNILYFWLGVYPSHTESFIKIILVICLSEIISGPRFTVLRACGKIKIRNMCRSFVICLFVLFAFLWFKRYNCYPEIALYLVLSATILTEFIDVLFFVKYMQINLKTYINKVYLRCLGVSGISILFIYTYHSSISFSNPIYSILSTCIFSCIVVILCSYYVGINEYYRLKIRCLIKNKIKHL